MIVIKDGKILTMDGKVYEKGSILIEKGKIKEVSEDLVAPLDAKIIDAKGKWVVPGMIDAHSHLGMWEDSIGFEGADGNEMTDPITPQLRAIDGINPMDITLKEAYEGGVTCVATGPGSANVLGGQFAAIKTCGNRIDDMIVKEPLAMKCAFGENPKRVYNMQKKSPMTRMATAALLREYLYKAKEYDKKKQEAIEDPKKAPSYNMKLEALIPVIRKEIPLKAHAHRADDIFTAIRIAKELDVRVTLDHCTEGHLIKDAIYEEQVPALVGPTFGDRCKFELKNKSFKTAKELSEKGVLVAIITDHPVIPIQHLPMCAAFAVKAGMEPLKALRAITIDAAKILEIDDRIGSIKEGKDADVVIWNTDPLDLKAYVECTIMDGKIVYENK